VKKTKFGNGTQKEAEELLKKTEKGAETKRVQCVLFGVMGMTSEQIAPLVGYTARHVRQVWSWYRKGSWKRITGERRGETRNKAHLTLEQEKEFLSNFEKQAISGNVVTAKVIQNAHSCLLGKKLDETVTYRLLWRHGWKKKTARPQHPKHNHKDLKRFKEAIFPPGYDPYENSGSD